MNPKTLFTIEGCPVTWDGEKIRFKAYGRVDDDGSGPGHGDKYHQGDTSLHRNGKPLNADTERYIVVPPQIVMGIPPIVLGSLVTVTYKGRGCTAVVGDIGPRARLGEASRAVWLELGVSADPNIGGVDSPEVQYEIFVGQPALIDGVQYYLQKS